MKIDPFASYIQKALNLLMLTNPLGTCMGIVAGGATKGLLAIFAAVTGNLTFSKVAEINNLAWICIFVFIFNLPRYIRGYYNLPADVERLFAEVRKAHSDGLLTQAHARMHCHALLTKAIQDVTLKKNMADQLGVCRTCSPMLPNFVNCKTH